MRVRLWVCLVTISLSLSVACTEETGTGGTNNGGNNGADATGDVADDGATDAE